MDPKGVPKTSHMLQNAGKGSPKGSKKRLRIHFGEKSADVSKTKIFTLHNNYLLYGKIIYSTPNYLLYIIIIY